LSSRKLLAFSQKNKELLRAGELRVVVTGATGWLGQASLEMLENALGDEFAQRVYAFGSHARPLAMRSGHRIEIAPLVELGSLALAPTLLLHYAFVTKERVAGLAPGAYFRIGEKIATTVARSISRIGVEEMLFPSSGAVYGLPTRSDRSTRDDPIDNPYGTQKLRDEKRFSLVCEKHGIRLAIPRIFNVSGPLINKHDGYVLSSVINSALAGAPVELRARRRVVRGYVAVRDVLDAAIGWLLAGSEPERLMLDTGGEIAEVGELALKVLEILGRADLPVKRPPLGSDPDDVYLGNGARFERLAGDQGISLSPLDEQILDTAEYLKELQA
jgi:nucleoside-diphosphate-sugar epimerase